MLRFIRIPAIVITALLCLKPSQGAFFKKVSQIWVVQKSSTLKINGSSNVSNFQCAIDGYYSADSLHLTGVPAGTAIPLKGSLSIDISAFDCQNRIITSDLRKTLKADKYPKLLIRFTSLERMPVFDKSNTDAVKGSVEVELAGACRKFDILFSITKTGLSGLQLTGVKDFCFSDFNLKPPKKIGGLIRVNNRFTVNFHLLFSQVIK
jgi:hypothetical protein